MSTPNISKGGILSSKPIPVKRFVTELEDVMKLYDLEMPEDNMRHWKVAIIGSINTPYSEGVYILDIIFPDDYPFKPPDIKFETKIYHPNISTSGKVCLGMLTDWKPIYQMKDVLMLIVDVMSKPDASDPLNHEAASLYTNNRTKYLQTASEWNTRYALM
jgi:ubiquitin-protein ligase